MLWLLMSLRAKAEEAKAPCLLPLTSHLTPRSLTPSHVFLLPGLQTHSGLSPLPAVAMVLNQEQFSLPQDTRQCLQTFLIVPLQGGGCFW